MKVRHATTHKIVGQGDTIEDFRGDVHIFRQITREPSESSVGKILTNHGEYYPSVFDLVIVEDQETDPPT